MDSIVYYYENYTPVGDVSVLGTCLVFIILMHVAYNIKNKNYRLLQMMIGALILGTISSIVYHMLMNQKDTIPHFWLYLTRFTQHMGYSVNLWLFVIYVLYPLQLGIKAARGYIIAATSGLVVLLGYDLFGTIFKFGFYFNNDGTIHEAPKFFFALGYAFFVGLIVWLLLAHRGRMVKQILWGIIGTFGISFLVMSLQGMRGQMSFTSVCYMFPIITLMYMIHSNPYNIDIGSVNVNAFDDMISYIYNKKKDRVLMGLLLPEFEGTGKQYPSEIREVIRAFTSEFFRGAVLFQLSGGRIVLCADPKRNPDYKESAQKMLDEFYHAYDRFQLDYKILFLKSTRELSERHDYLRLFQYVEKRMDMNSVTIVDDKLHEDFQLANYVLSQLEDIKKTGDLNDPRVSVYCQPVLNIATGKYDTAEALMRLNLPDKGMVFPDVFIPVAEEHNLIHVLSRVILFKTCVHIKKLMGQGFYVQRISVNYSTGELRDPNFCKDINDIITDVGIPYEKIAIEITESQNESDFRIAKKRIEELRDVGIKFYLDDFGTGYSNFERIMELPFDIIKFDRSLVIACGSDEKSEKMVSHLASMFSAMNYSVLYEGVETDTDEEKCIRMCAKYLQGYKYSKPIPIDDLIKWFEQAS